MITTAHTLFFWPAYFAGWLWTFLTIGFDAGRASCDRWIGRRAAAAAAGPDLFYEQAFATEAEAESFAARLRARGLLAEVAKDPYDYTWTVEVRVAAAHKEK